MRERRKDLFCAIGEPHFSIPTSASPALLFLLRKSRHTHTFIRSTAIYSVTSTWTLKTCGTSHFACVLIIKITFSFRFFKGIGMNHLGGPLTQHLFTCVLFGLVDTFQVLSVNEKTLEGIYRRLFFFFPPAKGFFWLFSVHQPWGCWEPKFLFL